MAKLFANTGDPGQMPCAVASDLGLHCLPITILWSLDYNGLRFLQNNGLMFYFYSAKDFDFLF